MSALEGKVTLVTGASSGLGAETAQLFSGRAQRFSASAGIADGWPRCSPM